MLHSGSLSTGAHAVRPWALCVLLNFRFHMFFIFSDVPLRHARQCSGLEFIDAYASGQ